MLAVRDYTRMELNRREFVIGSGLVVAGAAGGCLGDGDGADGDGGGNGDGGDGDDGQTGGGVSLRVNDHPDHGRILVDGDGITLYLFTQDGEEESSCYDDCAAAWPPFTVEGEVDAPEEIGADVTTFERDDGTTQVAYDGMPLYYYAEDTEPGETNGEGAGDVWFVVEVGSGEGSGGNGGGDEQLATVVLQNNSFQPNELQVEPGRIVAWVNQDDHPHTVTSDSGNWEKDTRVEGDSGATSYTFEEEGVYDVTCTIHSGMSMTITVGDP